MHCITMSQNHSETNTENVTQIISLSNICIVKLESAPFKMRFNFNKVTWDSSAQDLDNQFGNIEDISRKYNEFM